MSKVSIYSGVISLGFLALAACHGGGSGNGGSGIVPIQDTSSTRFTPDKEQSNNPLYLSSSSKEGCETNDSPNFKKVDSRLTLGTVFSENFRWGGSSKMPAMNVKSTTTIVSRSDTSLKLHKEYAGIHGEDVVCSVKEGSPSLDCPPVSGGSVSQGSTDDCKFTADTNNSGNLTDFKSESGTYRLDSGNTVKALRGTFVTKGRASCNGADIGPASQTSVMVQTYDVPSTAVDGRGSFRSGISNELTNYVGQ